MKFLILVALIPLAYGFHSNLACPNRPVMQEFEIKKLAGTWYNVKQYQDDYAVTFLCGHGNYSVIDEHSLMVHECEIQKGKYECLTGIISLNDPNHIRKEGRTSYAYSHKPHEKVDEFKYMHVEYDDYAIVYECKDKPDGKSIHSLWIASRTPKLSENAKEKVDRYIKDHFHEEAIKDVVHDPEVCEPRNVPAPNVHHRH